MPHERATMQRSNFSRTRRFANGDDDTFAHTIRIPFLASFSALYCTCSGRFQVEIRVFAGVFAKTSIVGYQNQDTTLSGAKMMSPTFIAVTAEKSCTLADLTVTGYDAPVYDPEMGDTEGGCLGDFVVQFLNGNGTTKASYRWIDDGNELLGWYADRTGKPIEGGASSVEINAGDSLWTIGKGMTLVSAGAVLTSDIRYKTPLTGAVALGNATPVDITLNKLVVSGYDTPVYDPEMGDTEGGCLGDFVVQFLNPNGTTKATYRWIDDGNENLGWYADRTGTPIEGGASSISIPTGQGMWIIGKGYELTIPAPEL